MKNVSISYNPYKLKTHITVDGKELTENSELRERSAEGNRLQEWVEDLPDMLLNEFNDNKFAVSFHGTIMDYEDLKEVLDEAQEQHKFWYHLKWEKAQETADKEKLIDEVFAEIQNGPFEELKSDEIKTAFQNAKSNDFEVCVVATMSAGKSTLINAMLGKELMPSQAGACTAMITRIKDVDQQKDSFQAAVYRKGRLSETYEELDYSIMERLNEDDTVDEVRVYGNMPFVSSDDLSLVLVDTPGPNNARDDSHEEVQQNALGKSSKALVLYIMTNEYGTDDDEITLRRVANTMSVGGKQSKDRFLFVVNKMDCRSKGDGSIEETLDQVREYLKAQGINNPNLFPAAALPALNIRRMEKEKVDEDIEEETEFLIRKLNRNEELHLEKYASIPGSEKDDIEEQLEKTRKEWKEKGGEKNENPQEALIHTGIISIEAAIRQYVEKYAKTARIKNIVDTFEHELEELDYNEKAKMPLERYKEERDEISRKIEEENKNLHNYGKVSHDVEAALRKIVFDAEDTAEKIEMTYKKMLQKISVTEEKMSKDWQEKYLYFRWSFSEYMRENEVGIQKIIQEDVDMINQLFMNNMVEIKDLFENIKKEIRERAKNESYRRIAEESGKLQKINFAINQIENNREWLTYIREKMNAILEI